MTPVMPSPIINVFGWRDVSPSHFRSKNEGIPAALSYDHITSIRTSTFIFIVAVTRAVSSPLVYIHAVTSQCCTSWCWWPTRCVIIVPTSISPSPLLIYLTRVISLPSPCLLLHNQGPWLDLGTVILLDNSASFTFTPPDTGNFSNTSSSTLIGITVPSTGIIGASRSDVNEIFIAGIGITSVLHGGGSLCKWNASYSHGGGWYLHLQHICIYIYCFTCRHLVTQLQDVIYKLASS